MEGSGGNTGIGGVHVQGQESPWDTSPKSHDTVGHHCLCTKPVQGSAFDWFAWKPRIISGSENVIVNGSAQIL